MNNKLKFFFTLSFISLAYLAAAQTEICDNGIDDDGDGFIDCYDGECSSDGACDDFFFGNVVECADDIDVTSFAIRLQWASEDRSANSHATPMVGDLDGNGIPEVVVTNKQRRSLFILNGASGATLFSNTSLGFQPENVPVLGDIDRDEFGEILVSQDQGDDMALLDHEANVIWTAKSSRNDAIGLPAFADFDEDGDVEIYYRNEVVDATTGNVLIAGDNIDWERNFTHGSLAVDVLDDAECVDCEGLELISGNEIYSINEAAGTRTLIKDMDDVIHADIDPNLNYYPKYFSNWDDQWSSVSAADYNLDGHMDLIITGALGTSTQTFQGETTIFFWDVFNETVITFHDPSNNFVRGPGRVNIGDVDGDGQLNANFVMNQKLYSLDENFNIHWIRPIKEGSSGFTGCSLFDFDGDGAVEVTYRSEESLLIIDGIGNGDNTTNIRREVACVSRTQEEYPVIADVDGDGASEICVTCYSNNSTPFSPYSNTEFAQVRVYESDGESWMPARGVWNQHAYFNVNINDDLTIPIEVQDHTRVFSEAGTCEYADGSIIPFDSRPLNTFINQSPILNEDGCVEFASPDIEFVGILNATDAECPDATIDVTYEIRNIGDIAISGNLPVSYYSGDPRLANGSMLLDTEVTTLVNFEPETTLEITQTITGIGGNFQLFVVINDNGSNPPITVPLPTSTIPECDTENNIQSTSVGFARFELESEPLTNNRKCDPTLPDNGSARAYYFGVVPGQNGTIWVENFEDRAISDQNDTDETAWTSDPGTQTPNFYGVANYNGSQMFNAARTGGANDEGEVTWTSQAVDISEHTDVSVTLDLFENGNQESSGRWRDYIIATYELRDNSNTVTASGELTNGRQFGNFDYAQALLTGINNAGQGDSLITITVTIHNTSGSELHYLDNVSVQGTPIPIPSEQTEADGFVFNWYNIGDTTNIIHTGSSISQLDSGTYIVEGFFGATLCFSALDTVRIDLEQPIIRVHTAELSPQTQCINPNGSAIAFAYTQTQDGTFPSSLTNPPLDTLLEADGYEVTWTLDGDLFNTVIGIGNTLADRQGETYRATIIDQFTGCEGENIVEIDSEAEDVDGLTASRVNINTCGGTGEVSALVNGDIVGYTFEWFDGTSIKPASDFIGAVYTVNDPGFYTVVATDDVTGCTSPPETIEVTDEANAPILAAVETQPNTTCGNNPTGIAQAEVNGSVGQSGFTYTWFEGANTLPGNELPDPGNNPAAFGVGEWELRNLSAGTYTIIVEETATNCTDTTTVLITDDIITPTIVQADVDLTPNTSCDPLNPNGIINASVAITPASSYTYSLYSGFVVDAGNLIETNTTGSFAGLAPDSYTISAIDQNSQCVAAAVTVTVPDQPDNPIITANPIADEFCIGGNGQIQVTSSSNVTEPGSYTYEIFEGFSFANEIVAISDVTVSDGATGYTFMGLADGNYRIRVTNDNLDCTSFEDVVVGDNSVIPVISASRLVNPNSSCDPLAPNGTIAISVDEVGFDATEYDWEWYQGSTVDASFLLSNPEAGEGASVTIDGYTITNNSVIGLPAGDYTVFARDQETGCKTVDLTLTVTDEPNPINVNTAVIAPQTFCDEGNGSVSASVDGTVLGLPCNQCVGSDGFTFEWFFGNDTSNPLDDSDIGGNGTLSFNSDNTQVDGLVAGNYTVRARETNTQCFSTQTITVNTDFDFPDPDATTTPNSVCDDTSPLVNFDGSLTVTGTDNSGAIDFSLGQFEIALYAGVGISGTPTIQTNNTTFDQLEDGSYTVVITNTTSGCSSNPETYVVDRNITDFSADINAVDFDQISCDLTNPLGQIVADVAGSTTGYTFQLFLGATEITTNIVDNSPTDITFDQLASGSYRLVVTSETSGCAYDQTVVVEANQVDPVFDNTSTDPNARCTGPDGIINFDINAGVGADARAGTNYLAELFVGNSITPTATPIDNNTLAGPSAAFSFTGLVDDDYVVRVTDLTTGCEITELFTVIYDGPDILIDETAIVRGFPTDCFSSGGNIDITNAITIDNPDASTSISIEWFIGGDTLPANALPTGGLFAGTNVQNGTGSVSTTNPAGSASATGLILDQIPAISYTALIRLDNGCVETVNISLPEADPPTVTFTPTDPTDCSPSDGSLQIDIQTNAAVVGDIADNYEFTLFRGVRNVGADSNPGSPYDPSITDGDEVPLTNFNSGTNIDSEIINNLESGTYTVIVRRDPASPISADECPVGVLTFTLQEPPSPVVDNIDAINNTNCADGADGGIEYNGRFSLTSTYNGAAEDMDFGLYVFDGTSFTFVANNASPNATAVNGDNDFDVVLDPDTDNNGTDDDLSITGLGELAGGLRFAIIAESANAVGCQDTTFFDIFNDPTVIIVSGTSTDIEDCNGPNDLGNFIVDTYPGADTELNYEFTWLDETGTPEAPITGAGAGSRDYTTDGNYHVIVRSLANGCETQIDFTINDNTDDPVVVISQDANDTHCEPTTGTGALSASVITGVFDANEYIFTWYQGSSVDPDSLLANPETGEGADVTANGYIIGGTNGEAITNLPEGFYTVSVRDNSGADLGCESVLVSNVTELQEIPTLTGIEVTPDSLCNLPTSGQFVIEDIDFSPGVISDYTITVERGSLGSGVLIAGDFGTPGQVTYTNLEADAYFVSAIKNASGVPSENTGCSIAPVRVDIEDISTLPLVTLERVVSDQNCGAGATNAGELEVLVDGQYDHTTPRYTFLWEIAGGGPVPGAVTDNQASLVGVPEGSYQVTVTNTNTGCSVIREYEVPNTIILPNITSSIVTPITNCTPDNGSYELVEVTYDGVLYTDGGTNDLNGAFELEVRRAIDNSLVNGIINASPFGVQDLAEEDYYAQVRHIATSCLSEPFDFSITDEATLPLVILSLAAADSTCQAGFTPNGIVNTTVTGGPITDFSFQWYFGAAADIGGTAIPLDGTPLANGSIPVGFDQATISGLAAGLYSVQVAQTSNGCIVSEEILIPNSPAEVEITSTDVTSSTNCFGNGGIEITGVTKNGLADNLTNYVFDFYTIDPNEVGATPVFTTDVISGPVYSGAMGGTTYYIIGTQTVIGCTTPVFEVVVPENLVYPEITLSAFETQSNCDPDNPNGSLTALADGFPENATYDFTWYFGIDTSNPLDGGDYQGGQNLSGETTNAVSGLAAGFYTVEVLNVTSGCSTVETFEMVNETPDNFALSTSVSPNTSCSDPNGRVAASVLNPLRDEITGEFRQYEFYWYLSRAEAEQYNPNTAIFIGSSIEDLPQGNYYVFAVDATDNFCNSVIERVEVLDEITPPVFSLETRDVTVCFDDKDGFAELMIDDLSTVTVTWLNDQNDSIGSGFFVDSLDAGLYTVRVVNNITQCPAEEVFEIFNNAETPNAPFAIVNNNRTNCSVPNGSAIANVDGVTNNFLIEWFDPLDLNTPYATGSQVTNLDSITYLVRATNIITGCQSDFTQVDIQWEEIVPEFEVVVDNSICLRTEDGATNQFTGSAFLQFAEFNLPETIEWSFITRNDAGEIIGRELVSTDARLIDAFPGEYEVRVIPENGCEYFRTFNIDVTLNVYNGLSANGDGKNDFFLIDCIDYFPSNNVKIFNRAGQRIFEIDSYDNRENRFEGISNVGGGGLVLPTGTYFYLVDLGTGEDPIQGYLELVR